MTSESELIRTAKAVVDRWDTPLWKDAPATAGYINALREALAAIPQGEAATGTTWDANEHGLWCPR